MEGGRKQPGSSSSSSSFTSELFGSKDSSSSAILGSIFAPSSKYKGEGADKQKRDPASQNWRLRSDIPGDIPQRGEEASQGTPNRDVNPFYQEEKVQPCHLSSSIYYGGPDVYARPKNSQSSTYTTFNKDEGEDDSGSASRGNWWQGTGNIE